MEAVRHLLAAQRYMKLALSPEIVQQWQYPGRVKPELLTERAFSAARGAGLTSLQSYVCWAEIEKQPGKLDFSAYDELVDKLAACNLKWVPFLILGPDYATPDWFHQSERAVYARCLEHGLESKIQSIWNPHLPEQAERFLELIAERYGKSGVLESVVLGISGNWGEALYPVSGGFRKDRHTHPGWWCGDRYALADFRNYAAARYGSLDGLNRAWGAAFSAPADIHLPDLRQSWWLNLAYRTIAAMPRRSKSLVGPALSLVRAASGMGFGYFASKLYSPAGKDTDGQTRWLDFVDWYLGSMTRWGEFWLKTARRCFPVIPLYLATGGTGEPRQGADFAGQARLAARYGAGIRITNQSDHYGPSFAFSRLTSSASRFYEAYFTTEEGAVNDPEGVIMRVFDAATSGARGFYCKSIIGTGPDLCSGRGLPAGEPTRAAANLVRSRRYLTLSEPVVEIAVFFPNSAIAIDRSVLASLHERSSHLRDLIEFDLVDELMVADGALAGYRFLVMLAGAVYPPAAEGIAAWVKQGGVFIRKPGLNFAGDLSPGFFLEEGGLKSIEKGYTLTLSGGGWDFLRGIGEAVYNRAGKFPWSGSAEIDGERDGVYASRLADRILYYNSNPHPVRKKVEIKNLPGMPAFELNMEPHSIVAREIGSGLCI